MSESRNRMANAMINADLTLKLDSHDDLIKELIECVGRARQELKDQGLWDSLTDGMGEGGCFMSTLLNSEAVKEWRGEK